jgi:hypothetical protein
MSIISILTTYSAREVSPKIFSLPLSWLIVIGAPLWVLALVSPSGMVVGVIPSRSWIVIVSVFSFIFMSRIGHIQLFKCIKLLNGKRLNKVDTDIWLS